MTGFDAPAGARPRLGGQLARGLVTLLLFLLAVFLLWSVFTLHWSYSDGERAGLLQKFSRKGWLCKTYEGELAISQIPGVAPQIWRFSVRDRRVSGQVERAVGAWVRLHYTEHPGVPTSCFAETRYFVDRVEIAQAPFALPAPPSMAPQGPSGPASSSSTSSGAPLR